MNDSADHPSPRLNDQVSLQQFQQLIRDMYFEKDAARGIAATFLWLSEEFGELASALRETEHARSLLPEGADTTDSDVSDPAMADFQAKQHNLEEEFADVLAWLTTIANVAQVDLSKSLMNKYGSGCPGCRQFVCTCRDDDKP